RQQQEARGVPTGPIRGSSGAANYILLRGDARTDNPLYGQLWRWRRRRRSAGESGRNPGSARPGRRGRRGLLAVQSLTALYRAKAQASDQPESDAGRPEALEVVQHGVQQPRAEAGEDSRAPRPILPVGDKRGSHASDGSADHAGEQPAQGEQAENARIG